MVYNVCSGASDHGLHCLLRSIRSLSTLFAQAFCVNTVFDLITHCVLRFFKITGKICS